MFKTALTYIRSTSSLGLIFPGLAVHRWLSVFFFFLFFLFLRWWGGVITRKPSQAVNLSSLFPGSLLQHRLNSIMETGTFCLLSSGHFLLVAMAHVETVDLGVFTPPLPGQPYFSTRGGTMFLCFTINRRLAKTSMCSTFSPPLPPPQH